MQAEPGTHTAVHDRADTRTEAPLRMAIAGLGVIGQRHVAEIRANPACRLVAIADPSPAAAEGARGVGVPHHSDAEQMLDRERPDAVIICTPNHLHEGLGLACVARGIAVLVEKPIADTVRAALSLADAAALAKVPLLVGHHRRHNVAAGRMRELVRSGALGRLVAVNIMCLLLKPDVYFEAPWRRQPGGGPILINLIHEIDLLRFICGEVKGVQAVASSAIRQFEVEDTVACTLELEGGALANITLSDTAASPWSWDTAAGEDKALFHHRCVPTHFFIGTEGACSMPDMVQWHYPGERGRQAPIQDTVLQLPEANTYARQLAHFIRVARRQEAPIIDGHDAARTLAVTLAVQTAARTGRRMAMAEAMEAAP